MTGSDEFKLQVFWEAVFSGAFRPEQITGYKPSKADLEVIRDRKPALKIANESNVNKSYVVEKSYGSGTSSAEQVHLPRLKY